MILHLGKNLDPRTARERNDPVVRPSYCKTELEGRAPGLTEAAFR